MNLKHPTYTSADDAEKLSAFHCLSSGINHLPHMGKGTPFKTTEQKCQLISTIKKS